MTSKILAAFVIVLAISAVAFAQARTSLPRVGLIKDYPATGMTVGCGNLYSELVGTKNNSGDKYVFLARGDGTDGWMNLNGRDTKLRLIRTDTEYSGEQPTVVRHVYRYARSQIIITITPRSETDPDGQTPMTISLKRGRATRDFHALVSSDC
jgi:hypothetical protein